MTKNDYSEFARVMKRAATATAHQKGTDFDELVVLLFEELAVYSLSQIKAAVGAHVRSERFFPMLADIVTRIEGKPEARAEAAWNIVVNAVRRTGGSNSIAFPSPAFNYAISQIGGWIQLCETLREEEIKWRGKEFVRAYVLGEHQASWEREDGKIAVDRYCVGRNEYHNRKNRFELPDVIDGLTNQPLPDFRRDHARRAIPSPDYITKELSESMRARA